MLTHGKEAPNFASFDWVLSANSTAFKELSKLVPSRMCTAIKSTNLSLFQHVDIQHLGSLTSPRERHSTFRVTPLPSPRKLAAASAGLVVSKGLGCSNTASPWGTGLLEPLSEHKFALLRVDYTVRAHLQSRQDIRTIVQVRNNPNRPTNMSI